MIFVLINVLIIVVVGALIFFLIDRFARDGRLANLLKILVVLMYCLAAISAAVVAGARCVMVLVEPRAQK